MMLPLQVVFRDMAPLPSLEGEIRERAAKLARWAPDLTSCHVVVEAAGNRHHQGHQYEVKIDVRVPDSEIVVGGHQRDENIERALHAAFDALDRQLEDRAQRRRGETKHHADAVQGRIAALSDDGSGRIDGADGEAYHFDRSHVEHPRFEALAVGQAVHFVPAATRTGREARKIRAA